MRNPRTIGMRKHVTITVIPLVGRRGTRRRVAPAGQLITPEGIDGILQEEAEIVDRFFPGSEFRLVALRDGNFNFVQMKSKPAEIEPSAEPWLHGDVQAPWV